MTSPPVAAANKAAIIITSRDVAAREVLEAELRKRYGAVGEGAATIPLVHRWLEAMAVPHAA